MEKSKARPGVSGAIVMAPDLQSQADSLSAVLSHMSQGVCMFDGEQRLIACNMRYLDIYGLPPEIVRPGITLMEILRHRIERGNVPELDAEGYIAERLKAVRDAVSHTAVHQLRDGRVIAVGHEPMAGGGWLTTHDDITQIYTLQREIFHLAYHDHLTGLPNRRKLNEAIDEALGNRRHADEFALLLIDLDGFKAVNDTLGHSAGDALLQSIAGRLTDCVRDCDMVARIGGDEFAGIQTEIRSVRDARHLSARLLDRLDRPFAIEGRDLSVRASIGIAVAEAGGPSREELLKQADAAMYRAKRAGGQRCCYFGDRIEPGVVPEAMRFAS